MDDKEKKKPKKRNKKQGYKLDGMPASELKMKYFKNKRRQKRIKTKIFQAHFFLKVLAILLLLWLSSRLMISKFWFLPQTTFSNYPNPNLRIIGNYITPDNQILNALKAHPIPELPIYLINTSSYEKCMAFLNHRIIAHTDNWFFSKDILNVVTNNDALCKLSKEMDGLPDFGDMVWTEEELKYMRKNYHSPEPDEIPNLLAPEYAIGGSS